MKGAVSDWMPDFRVNKMYLVSGLVVLILVGYNYYQTKQKAREKDEVWKKELMTDQSSAEFLRLIKSILVVVTPPPKFGTGWLKTVASIFEKVSVTGQFECVILHYHPISQSVTNELREVYKNVKFMKVHRLGSLGCVTEFLALHGAASQAAYLLAVRGGAEMQEEWDKVFLSQVSHSHVFCHGDLEQFPVFDGWSPNGAPIAKGRVASQKTSGLSPFLVSGCCGAKMEIWRTLLPLKGDDGWLDAAYAAARFWSLHVPYVTWSQAPASGAEIWQEPVFPTKQPNVLLPQGFEAFSGIYLQQRRLEWHSVLGIVAGLPAGVFHAAVIRLFGSIEDFEVEVGKAHQVSGLK